MSGLVRSYIAEDEDGGGCLGVLLDLPNGDQVWSGEIADATFSELSEDERDTFETNTGPFVIHATTDRVRALCRASDTETAMELAEVWAASLLKHGTSPAGEAQRRDTGLPVLPDELRTAAQALIDAVAQDQAGNWVITGDGETLAGNLLSALAGGEG